MGLRNHLQKQLELQLRAACKHPSTGEAASVFLRASGRSYGEVTSPRRWRTDHSRSLFTENIHIRFPRPFARSLQKTYTFVSHALIPSVTVIFPRLCRCVHPSVTGGGQAPRHRGTLTRADGPDSRSTRDAPPCVKLPSNSANVARFPLAMMKWRSQGGEIARSEGREGDRAPGFRWGGRRGGNGD